MDTLGSDGRWVLTVSCPLIPGGEGRGGEARLGHHPLAWPASCRARGAARGSAEEPWGKRALCQEVALRRPLRWHRGAGARGGDLGAQGRPASARPATGVPAVGRSQNTFSRTALRACGH